MLNFSDEKLIEEVPEINLVLGGHEHCYFIKRNQRNMVVKSGSNFECFNEIILEFSEEAVTDTLASNSKLKCSKEFYFYHEKTVG